MRLKQHVAVVTGAARGIGRAHCVALAREGARIVAADIRSCAETVAAVQAAGGEAIEVHTDVTNGAATAALAARALERFGRIDILVNNAAMLEEVSFTPFDEIPEADWDKAMAVNVKGVWNCCKAVVPAMRRQGRGRIINTSSSTIWMGTPMFLHYVASKGAVLTMTRSLARELAGTGITVNAITPGYTLTEAALKLSDPATVEKLKLMLIDLQIVKRSEQPEDLTGTVVFLASDDSEFMTGQTLNVDGGAAHH